MAFHNFTTQNRLQTPPPLSSSSRQGPSFAGYSSNPSPFGQENPYNRQPQDVGPPIIRSRTLYYLSIRDSNVSSSTQSRSRKYSSRTKYGDERQSLDGRRGRDGDQEETEGLMGSIRRAPGGTVAVDMDGLGSPPKWMHTSEEVEGILSRARLKVTALEKLHAKHVLPGFTDRSFEEREIEAQTADITRDFRKCHSLLSSIPLTVTRQTQAEATAAKNVQRALAVKVQDVSGGFRKVQRVYMDKMQGQAVKNKDLLVASGAITLKGSDSLNELKDDIEASNSQLQAQTFTQQNRGIISQRNQEISQIATSIADLADLFQSLSGLVVEQGTVLDSVEYNVMETAREVKGAEEELNVAQNYQRNTGRRKCILLLILIILGLFIVLIYKPRSSSSPSPPSPSSSSSPSSQTEILIPVTTPTMDDDVTLSPTSTPTSTSTRRKPKIRTRTITRAKASTRVS